MNPHREAPTAGDESSILILADGRVLARNVTPAIAALLFSLQPDCPQLAIRTGIAEPRTRDSSAEETDTITT